MKITKGLLLFGVVVIGASSCFDPPEFPIEPKIDFESIIFKEVGGITDADSLILSLTFRDGNGDLGLAPDENEYPFNASDFFLSDSVPVRTYTGVSTEAPPRQFESLVLIDNGQSGKLATLKNINMAGFEFMKPYTYPFTCSNYLYDTFLIQDPEIIDASYNIIDTIKVSSPKVDLYAVAETFYFEKNPNHFNITVDFFIINASGTRTEFDWETYTGLNCGESYDGRFPVLSDVENKPMEGTLRYAMKSNGFIPLFRGKTLQLDIQIKDRARNRSNVIQTPPFTL